MSLVTSSINRRSAVTGVIAAALWTPARANAQTSLLLVTPAQAEGPFYPQTLPADMDNDLVRITGDDTRAIGTVLHISGRVTDVRGAPMRDAVVEIFSTDATGRYLSTRQRFSIDRDPHFQGNGRCAVDARGEYGFRTIRPPAYVASYGRQGAYRAAHVHYRVYVAGVQRLTTQFYFHDDPLVDTDMVLTSLPDLTARERLIVETTSADEIETNSYKARFDIVLADA